MSKKIFGAIIAAATCVSASAQAPCGRFLRKRVRHRLIRWLRRVGGVVNHGQNLRAAKSFIQQGPTRGGTRSASGTRAPRPDL